MTSQPTDFQSSRAAAPQRVTGQFRCALPDESWWWSDETYAVHGFAPGEVVPTTALVEAHRHPDDRDHVRRAVLLACRSGAPFSSMHRIMDALGRERTVVVVGQVVRDELSDRPRCLQGFVTDVTDEIRDRAAREATQQIHAALAGREIIDQAKGVLVLVYGMTCDEAFDTLRATSNARNVRVRDLAHEVVAAARRCGTAARENLDDLLVRTAT
jgi:hypothetical protein